MNYYFLAHARTPGSKNGERKYQNEDGTWTPLGLERRRAEYAESRKMGRVARVGKATVGALGVAGAVGGGVVGSVYAFKKGNTGRAFEPGKDGKPSPAEKVAKNVGDGIEQTKRMTDLFEPKTKRVYTDDLSNAELERMIRRMDLEKRYSDLSRGSMEKGRDWVSTSISAAGALASLGIATAGIITAIKKMKGTD